MIDFLAKRNWTVVLFSIFAGVITDLLWDSFTAINGYFVKSIPFFLDQYYFFDKPMSFYKIVKHVGSIVGAVLVLYQLYIQPQRELLYLFPLYITERDADRHSVDVNVSHFMETVFCK